MAGNKMTSLSNLNNMSSGFRRSNNVAVQPSVLMGGALAKILDLQAIRAVKGYAVPTATGDYLVYEVANNGQQLNPSDPNTSGSVMPSPLRIGTGDTLIHAIFSTTEDWVAAGNVTATLQTGTFDGTTVTGVTAISATSGVLPDPSLYDKVAGTDYILPLNIATNAGYVIVTTAAAAVSAGTLRITLLLLSA